ncbi:hypothetical protein D3C85_1498970 [compost metagenome]
MNGLVPVCRNTLQVSLQVAVQSIVDDLQHRPRLEGALLADQQVLQVGATPVQQDPFGVCGLKGFQFADKRHQRTQVGHG